jgi:histidine phosphotransfer protein HptB
MLGLPAFVPVFTNHLHRTLPLIVMSAPRPLAEAPTPLDAQALASLAELDPDGSAGLVPRVLRTFAGSMERLRAQLAAARERGDTHTQRLVAHTLKSSSASVGALQLSALCAEVERRTRDQQLDGLDDSLDQLDAEATRVAVAVQALLTE